MRNKATFAVWVVISVLATFPCHAEGATRLNNLVLELGNWTDTALPVGFYNPREGWVFVGISATEPGEAPVTVISESGEMSWAVPANARGAEGMRWLVSGWYTVRCSNTGLSPVNAVVRAVPELHYCRFPVLQRIPAFGLFDWPFLEAHILPHVNTVVGPLTEESDGRITEWTDRGGKWIDYYHLPHQEGITGQDACEYWAQRPGFQDPRLSGLIADEFQGREHPLYPAWIEGIKLLGASPASQGRAFYGYCGGPGMFARPQARELVRTMFAQDFYMAYERYLHEERTLEEMRALMDELLGGPMMRWRETFPGCHRRMVLVLGLFAQGFGLNVHPDVDFKVHMDLQMQYVATHRAFEDLFGLHWWTSDFSDDETMKWLGQLYRHYAIEGNTGLLSEQYGYTYELNHVTNPDFFDGFRGWTAVPASIKSMETRYMERYARMQGRYWHRNAYPDEPAGNTYLWMQRRTDKPNHALQTVRGLKPGALYSAKMVSADYTDITEGVSRERLLGVALNIDNAEVLAEKSFQAAYPSQRWEPFLDQPAWFNLHRVVFRATDRHATIHITDWPDDSIPADADSGALMVNFIEVQPYFDPAL